MSAGSISMAPGLLVAFMLVLVRASAWLALAPPFNSRLFPTRAKAALAIGLAVCVAPHITPAIGNSTNVLPLSDSAFIGSILLQAITGLALGFISNMLFLAVQGAGSLVDTFGGFSISAAYDPLLLSQTTVMSRVYNLVATMLLFTSGADLLLVKGFMTSFQAAPLTGIKLTSLSHVLINELSTMFLAAFEIAAPLVAVLFLADVVLGMLTKAAPQLNAFSLGFPLKILITLSVLGTALPLLPQAVSTLVMDGLRDGLGLLRAVS